jgi:hypothetical protein
MAARIYGRESEKIYWTSESSRIYSLVDISWNMAGNVWNIGIGSKKKSSEENSNHKRPAI